MGRHIRHFNSQSDGDGVARKTRVRTLVSVSTVLFILVFYQLPLKADGQEEGWRLFVKDTAYSIRYYDTGSLTQLSSGRLSVWTKTVPTAEGNPRIREIDSLWEMDCPQRLFRNLQTRVIYTDGELHEAREPYSWTKVDPKIWIAPLYEIVCGKGSRERE